MAHHLRAWIAYRGGTSRLHDWRTRSGREVDFVEYGSEGFTALEVKRSRTVHSRDVRGLQAFRADYPEAELALLHRGDEALVIDGIRCLPVKAFLRGVHPARPLLGRGEGNV